MKIEVYETEDLPEADQNLNTTHETVLDHESIESIKINVEESLKKFQGKFLDSKTTDFSINTKKITGYGFLEDPHISLMRKIECIKNRIKSISEEIKIHKNQLEDADDNTNMFDEVNVIHKQLAYLRTDASLTAQPKYSNQASFITRLNDKVEKSDLLKSKLNSNKTENDLIGYQLVQWPDNDSVQNRKLALIEASIKRCESVVGDSSKLTSLKKDDETKTISDLLKLVVSKATISNANQLLKLEPRLTHMQQQSANALNAKTDSDLTDKVDKVSSFHVKIVPCMVLIDKIENVLKNLHLLNDNHISAYEFEQTVNHIQEKQANMIKSLQYNLTVLNQVELLMQAETSNLVSHQ